MSKPVFSDLFQFNGRRNRLSYLLVQLSTWVGTALGIFVGAYGLVLLDGSRGAAVLGAGMILVGFGVAIASIAAAWITAGQRCRDIGWPGWVCLAILVPYVGFVAALVVAIAPGDTREANKYGASCIN